MYEKMAHLYEWPGADDLAEWFLDMLEAHAESILINPENTAIELGCGTGLLLSRLAQCANAHLIGIDRAAPMLTLAREKLAAIEDTLAESVTLSPQALETFTVDTSADLIYSYDDTLNHLLTPDALRQCFTQSFTALKPGGLFLFDINTLENYRALWDGQDVYEGPNHQLNFSANFDEAAGRATVNVFAQEHTEDGLVHHEESMTSQYYPPETVAILLEQTGFSDIRFEPVVLERFLPAEPLKWLFKTTRSQ